MVIGLEVSREALGFRSAGFSSDLAIPHEAALIPRMLCCCCCCRNPSEEAILVEPRGEARTDLGRSSISFLCAEDHCGAGAGAMLLDHKPCCKFLLFGCADGCMLQASVVLSSADATIDAISAATQCYDSNQFAGDNLMKLKALYIPSFVQDLGMSSTDGETMGMVLMHLIQGLSKLLQVNLYLHTRVRCTTCCAAPRLLFFLAQFTTAAMPMCWRPSGSAGCNLMKLAGDDVGMLIRSCFGSTPVLLQIRWRPRALRLVSANQLPVLRMVQTRCYTLDILQVSVHAAYSIFMPLELIRRKRERAFPCRSSDLAKKISRF